MSTTDIGLFISFEGNEGSGKSTQLRLLTSRIESLGLQVVQNVEPGGTSLGAELRRVLLDPSLSPMSPTTELLLMFASRAQAVHEVIAPALRNGAIVLTDRFTDSSLAYQGCARGLGFSIVRELHTLTIGKLMPTLTVYVELDLDTSLWRAYRRNSRLTNGTAGTRFDEESLAFHQRVRDGYHRIAYEEPDRFKTVDGTGDHQQVAARVWALVEPLLKTRTAAPSQDR